MHLGLPVRAGALRFFIFYIFFIFRGKGFFLLFFLRWLGVALHSELGAQMAPKKPRPLQAASGKRTPQQLEAIPLLIGDQRVKLETGDGDYGT